MPKKLQDPNFALYLSPVVLVTSADEAGKPNIFTVVIAGMACRKPPMVAIGVHPWVYSHSLIKAAGEFVINIPPQGLLDKVDYCGSVSGREVDKFAETGLTPLPATKVKPPLIKECPVNYECVVKHTLELGVHHLFVAEVVAVHTDEEILDADGRIDIGKFEPVAYVYPRSEYWTLGEPLRKPVRKSGLRKGKKE